MNPHIKIDFDFIQFRDEDQVKKSFVEFLVQKEFSAIVGCLKQGNIK